MRGGSANPAHQVGPRKAAADAFRLRAEPPRVLRLSRKVLAVLMMTTCVGIGGALIYALQGRQDGDGQNELFATDNRPTADALRRLPSDYTGIPQLGPALPGDLGGPILRAMEEGRPIPAAPLPGPDPAEQRRLAEIEAARTSELFFETQSAVAAPVTDFAPTAPVAGQDNMAPGLSEDSQDAFLNAPIDRQVI